LIESKKLRVKELNEPLIEDLLISINTLPLKKPYKLSFVTLDRFQSIQVKLRFSNHKETIAEVVPLLGYNDESEEEIYDSIIAWKDELVGKKVSKAREFVSSFISQKPFTTSAILTAIDLMSYSVNPDTHHSIKYVVPSSTTETDELKSLLLNSRDSIKVKLTQDVDADINGLLAVKKEVLGFHSNIRFDANQAYDFEAARKFCELLQFTKLDLKTQYIEQPFPVGKENWIGELRKQFKSIAFMLDESIVTINDLDLATTNDVEYIKLKLFKQGGIKELLEIANEANRKGIKVILGNGVATSISNEIENEIYMKNKALFVAPLESNGFKKLI